MPTYRLGPAATRFFECQTLLRVGCDEVEKSVRPVARFRQCRVFDLRRNLFKPRGPQCCLMSTTVRARMNWEDVPTTGRSETRPQ